MVMYNHIIHYFRGKSSFLGLIGTKNNSFLGLIGTKTTNLSEDYDPPLNKYLNQRERPPGKVYSG